MNDYQKSFTIDRSATEVYAAITEHIRDWWTDDFSGAGLHANDNFNIAFDETRKTMKVTEAIPGERVVWECTKAYIDMASLKNKAEWEGTKMIWTISKAGSGTTLHFLHEGLNQSFECYEVCEGGWDMFLDSLETYLKTGKGKPYKKVVNS